jgi:hypothetical protein
MPYSLRSLWYLPFLSVVRFFALQAKKRTTKEDKVPLRMTYMWPTAYAL